MTGCKTKGLEDIQNLVSQGYNPTHMVSLQLPFEAKTTGLERFLDDLWRIVRGAERKLLGRHWINKPYPFIGFCERGRDKHWHAHILISCGTRPTEEVCQAFTKSGLFYQKSHRTDNAPDIDVRQVYDTNGATEYCSKQLRLDDTKHIRSWRIFTSETLFR
ncbi:MAG: hypothetical protein NC311_00015 [Muribaculaceae bacterium]|nr:hypothetical protein [Muribaculaceae bacterium]